MKPVISKPLLEFNKFYKELNDLYHETALNAESSESSFDILYSVFELGDGCLQSDIQKISFLPKQTINSSIHKLEKEGYISFSDGKGRSKHINLTPTGKLLIQEKIYPIVKLRKQFLFFIKRSNLNRNFYLVCAKNTSYRCTMNLISSTNNYKRIKLRLLLFLTITIN